MNSASPRSLSGGALPSHAAPHTAPRPRAARSAAKQMRHELVRRVHAGDVLYARKLTHSRTAIVLHYAGAELAFIYSNHSKSMLRLLPAEAPELAEWRASQAAARTLLAGGLGALEGSLA